MKIGIILLAAITTCLNAQNACKCKYYLYEWGKLPKNPISKENLKYDIDKYATYKLNLDSLNYFLSSSDTTNQTLYNYRIYLKCRGRYKQLFITKNRYFEIDGHAYYPNDAFIKYIVSFIPPDERWKYSPRQ